MWGVQSCTRVGVCVCVCAYADGGEVVQCILQRLGVGIDDDRGVRALLDERACNGQHLTG